MTNKRGRLPVKKSRPVNLNLFTIRFPLAAIVSILHRASGVILFLVIPALLWMLQMSLTNPWTYTQLMDCLSHPFIKLVLLAVLASLIYHLLAGIRHLLMDAHVGESKAGGTMGARIVLALSLLLTSLTGVFLW